jgi:hypothetical protein
MKGFVHEGKGTIFGSERGKVNVGSLDSGETKFASGQGFDESDIISDLKCGRDGDERGAQRRWNYSLDGNRVATDSDGRQDS